MQIYVGEILKWKNSYLVTEDADGAGGRHLLGAEPDGRESRWNRQDEDLRHCHDGVAREGHPEAVGGYRQHLDPRAHARAQGADQRCEPQTLKSLSNGFVT
jgi:hypothetical protein